MEVEAEKEDERDEMSVSDSLYMGPGYRRIIEHKNELRVNKLIIHSFIRELVNVMLYKVRRTKPVNVVQIV